MILYNFEENKDEVIIEKKNNSRYESLNKPWHRFFTAGDPEQFVSNIILDNRPEPVDCSDMESEEVKYISVGDMMITFEMLFHKFKKGCFIQFRQNCMETFLPFSKINYTNNWSHNIEIDSKFGMHSNNFTKFKRMLEYINQGTKYESYGSNFHRNTDEWYGNNGIFRFEYPLNEYDSGYPMLYDMFFSLSGKYNHLPFDLDFFLNKRDNPLKRKDGHEPYHHFFNGPTPMESKYFSKKDQMLPILSMNSGPEYEDYKIPTWECWRFFEYTRCKKIFLEKKNKDYKTFPHPNDFELDFDTKKPIAVFRGRSTGIGTFLHNNPRMFVCDFSSRKENMDTDNIPFVDAKLTEFNKRPKKFENDNFVRTVDCEKYNYLLGESLSYVQQSQYKYILHIPGHSCAYRLTIEMFFNSVILYFPHPTSMWFFDMLEPYVHYIPVEQFNQNAIIQTIKWCKDNNSLCKQIASNARKFAEKYLNSEYALDYLQNLLSQLASKYKLNYKNQKHALEEKMNRKINDSLMTFQSKLFDDTYKKYWIPNMYYFQSYLHYLQRNNSLADFFQNSCCQEKMIQKKKTWIDFHRFQGLEFICKHLRHGFKRDDLQQLLVGYTCINKLHEMFPDHFVYTLYHEIDVETTKIYLQYKPLKTLFDFIQQKKISFDELLLLWLEISCVLFVSQNMFGFIHGDLMSWNILIQEIPETKYIFFEELNIGFHRKFIPCIIDYGESHVVLDDISYYNSIPFTISKISDIVFLVLKSIENYISTIHPDFLNIPHKLTRQKQNIASDHYIMIQKIYKILQYLLPTINFRMEKKYIVSNISQETMKNINNDLWNIKNFCKKMSKYSKLLENIENYAKIGPQDFISFLFCSHCIPMKLIQSKVISSTSLYQPTFCIPNYNYYMKNKIWEKIIQTHSNAIIHHHEIPYFENIVKQIRYHYLRLFDLIQSGIHFPKYQNEIYHLFTTKYNAQLESLIHVLNERFNSKVEIPHTEITHQTDSNSTTPIQDLDVWWPTIPCQPLNSIYFTNHYDYHQHGNVSPYKFLVDLVLITETFKSHRKKSFFDYRTFQK